MMALFSGRQLDVGYAATPAWAQAATISKSPSETILALVGVDPGSVGVRQVGTMISFGSVRPGFRLEGMDDLIYGRVWLLPTSIALGLIAYDQDFEIKFWNATTGQITLNSITDSGLLDNCTIAASLPDTLEPNEEFVFTLNVAQEGDLEISGDKIFSYESTSQSLTLTGMRLIILNGEHNWADVFSVLYGFETLVTISKKLHEQRAQVLPEMRRMVTISLLERNPYLRNYLKRALNTVIAIPISSEPILLNMTGSLQGLSSLTAASEVEYYYNLRHLTDIMAIINGTSVEVRQVLSVSGKTISLDKGIVNNWNAEDVICYPLMTGFIEALKFDDYTAEVWKSNLQINEYCYGE